MRKPELVLGVLATLGFVLCTASASAQAVQVKIKNAPPNSEVEVSVSGSGLAESGTATASAGGDLSMLLNFGSLGKAAPVEISVYLEDCSDGARVHFVAAGGEAPECGDETQAGECNCRKVGAFWMRGDTTSVSINWSSGAVGTLSSGQKWTLGLGADFVSLDSPDPEPVSGTTRELSVDDSGTDFSLFLEYAPLEWLAFGIGYEGLGDIGLAATLTAIDDPSVQLLSRGKIDPKVLEFYARLGFWLRANVMLHAMLGGAYWETTTTSNERILVDGSEVDSFSSSFDHDGWAFLAGAGIDIWLAHWLGVRLAYKWLDLSQSATSDNPGVDARVRAARFLMMFRF